MNYEAVLAVKPGCVHCGCSFHLLEYDIYQHQEQPAAPIWHVQSIENLSSWAMN